MSFSDRAFTLFAGASVLFALAALAQLPPTSSRKQPAKSKKFEKLTFAHSACDEPCPVYKLTIYSNGRVEYQGEQFVKTIGKALGELTPEQLQQLNSAIYAVHYFSLRTSYEWQEDGCSVHVTDNPYVRTSVTINGKTKFVSHYYGCKKEVADDSSGYGLRIYPQELTDFERKIPKIVGVERWIGTPEERKKLSH